MRYISIFDTKSVHDSTTVRCTFYHLNLFFNRLQVILPFATQKESSRKWVEDTGNFS